MPPKGVTVLAECISQRQAEAVLAAYLKAEPDPQLDPTLMLGEDLDSVLRIRKTPHWWNVERWSRDALRFEAEDQADVPF
jgi:hypothetical protein